MTPGGEETYPPPDGEGSAVVPLPPAASLTGPADARNRDDRPLAEGEPHRISPLSLGAGMTLMGLGLGFLGLRLRRR
ncbi:hypothetical protein QCN29_19875 [Streptomyces sp. HNM0663]|uniref:Gram-positive cocci surface proteins LPxTG domain-containing protein n=1 Tax=Streptomyces chengmaiensis TaxID=3040919 RepID=A0ABT6HRS3_9ACTN|nr:hypothetical protein [Streptomyces chengmaiensis]MDH2391007.1 hypothetical protein [Streptomyces chengmaiensis]